MQQIVSLKEWNSLDIKHQKKLHKWGEQRDYYIWDINPPNIGIMIEFLGTYSYQILEETDYDKLCRVLWEAIKKHYDI